MTLPADGPNADARLLRAADIPTLMVGQTTASLVAVGADTDQRYGLFRWDMTAASGTARFRNESGAPVRCSSCSRPDERRAFLAEHDQYEA